MSPITRLRHYRLRIGFLGLLFVGCLAIALFAGSSATPASSPAVESAQTTRQSSSAKQTAKPVDAASLTLTKDVRKTVLDNGLTVLTKEVNTAPVVTVQVWYRVGSRNEAPGVNGIAHQLEHLMFKGTRERPIQFGRFLVPWAAHRMPSPATI